MINSLKIGNKAQVNNRSVEALNCRLIMMDSKGMEHDLEHDEISWDVFVHVFNKSTVREDDAPSTAFISTILFHKAINHLLKGRSYAEKINEAIRLVLSVLKHEHDGYGPILLSFGQLRDDIHSMNSEADKDLLLRRLQLQVMTRIKLYSIFSCSDDMASSFLCSYAESFEYQFVKKKTKKRDRKAFTLSDFINDLCSFLELSHFLLPRKTSFSSFVQSTVHEPFPELQSFIASPINEFFELDSDDSDNETQQWQLKNGEKNQKPSQKMSGQDATRRNSVIQRVEPEPPVIKDQAESKQERTANVAENLKHVKSASQEKLLSVRSIPITTHLSRNPLITRKKYVGSHFSQNAVTLLNQVKMGPRLVNYNSIKGSVFPDAPRSEENRIVKETPIKAHAVCSPSRKTKQSISPSVVRKKDPSNLVAAVMKLHSKSR